jgi:hypothetical protein
MEPLCPTRYLHPCRGPGLSRSGTAARSFLMLDIAFLMIGAIFLGACALYALACDHL